MRPRHLDSGFAMGTVAAMRQIFAEAVNLGEQSGADIGDRDVWSSIFGGQEVWREILRRQTKDYRRKDFPNEALEAVSSKAEARSSKTYDFGIGLDYASELSLNSLDLEKQSGWLQLNDTEMARQTRESLGVPSPQRQTTLRSDIANSLPPYWTFSTEADLDRSISWSEVPLYSNFCTGNTPAVVSGNTANSRFRQTADEGLAEHRWYRSHARTLMDAAIYAPILPVAVGGENAKMSHGLWPWEIWKGGAREAKSKVGEFEGWIRFDDICKDWHEELFQDGKGEWILLEYHWNVFIDRK